MEKLFTESVERASVITSTDLQRGLTAAQVAERFAKYGENKLTGKKEKTLLAMFGAQFKDFLVIILIVAAIVSVASEGYLEGVIIIAIVILNAVLGVFQENKANNALKALKEMASPHSKVLRDGVMSEVSSSHLVPGDVIILEAGDYVPADVRLIESVNLKIDEAALTGESVPSEKDASVILKPDAGVGDRLNSAFMGTVVTYGRGRGLVAGTGMSTQMGSIAKMLNETEDEITPLQTKLNSLGKLLGIICIVVCVAIFILGLLQKMDLLEIFIVSVSLAVAAIPEGLTVVVTVVLAMGMQKMVKSNAIVKRLSAVETLGSTTVICSDKTGTLTQNKMTVVELYDGEVYYEVGGTGYNSEGSIIQKGAGTAISENAKRLIEGAVLCNDSIFDKSAGKIIGDPTEGALLVIGEKISMTKEELNKRLPRVGEIPFDSGRKLMSTFHSLDGNQGVIMYTKGAPDEVLRRCNFIDRNGEVTPITEEIKAEISGVNGGFAENALRVLAVAYRRFDKVENTPDAEQELVFVGLLAMIDPPREEAAEAIKVCKKAGISVKMITGDHKITAGAIARQLGIAEDGGQSLEGRELDTLSDEELRDKVKTVNVFARVSPEHKVRLITAVRANGDIAAMTGDGVNDAPSLKRADIGVAMGITGTDVSKEAADMILTDDNFASIVNAVEEGRTIYNNIRRVVAYLLSCNIGEILIIFTSMVFGLPLPLVPVQLLAINLVTDAFPAFALGMEEKEDGIMSVPPRNVNEPIVNGRMQFMVAAQSIAIAVGSLLSYLVGRSLLGEEAATTFCFVTLVTGELLRAYSSRSEWRPIWKIKIFGNSFLNKSALFSFIFLLAAVYTPFLKPVFSTVALSPAHMLIAVGFALFAVTSSEIAKIVKAK